jgi:ATP-dependent DNA ligase
VGFPIDLPIKPMLAKLSREIPDGDGWLFEPKWDGFRCVVTRDGDEMELTSRSERPFTRYFPELLPVLADALPDRVVVDGEIVIPDSDGKGLDFDALLQRIHPAASRVNRLAEETPSVFVAFDLLAEGDESWLPRPMGERRARLLELVKPGPSVFVTPASTDVAVANDWFTTFEGAGLDGVVAKRLDDPYQPDKRALVKVKHQRTADCALAGYRIHKDGQGVGSMLLGLFDDDGVMHHVGVAAAFTASERKQLLAELTPMTENALDGHPWAQWAEFATAAGEEGAAQRRPGATSRWNAGKDLSWVPVRVERVVEVTFGQLENGRFRHGVTFVRWRPDRAPESCRYDQLDVASPVDFRQFMASSAGP